MKVINYVTIKNMYAHKNTTINFTEGKNYIVGPIGSGKTEVLQAIAFSFFGTTALRDKASSYKDIEVELNFNYKNEVFLIKRKINDASFLILNKDTNQYEEIVNSTSIVNQKIVSLFGYNYDIFLLSNFCQQKKLAYFSELTPAKRLQYIDKISGIEEAKDLLKYLTNKRKKLKDNINLLKDVTVEPKLSEGIDLSFDYASNIDVLNSRLNNVNSLYNEYNKLFSLSLNNLTTPSLSLFNPLEQSLMNLSEEDEFLCLSFFEHLANLKNELNILDQKIRDIPSIPSKYKNISLDEVNNYIDLYNISIVKDVANDLSVVCPTCSTQHNLNSILDAPVLSSVPFNIKDLHNIKDYITNNYKAIKEELEGIQTIKETQYNDLLNNSPVVQLSSFKNSTEFKSKLSYLKSRYALYLLQKEEYEEKEKECLIYKQQAETLKEEIDQIISSQSSDLELKDLYIKQDTEKQIYIERLDLYLQAKDKIDNFNIELKLINNLIKEINDITSLIKNQTIPLINYHASYFLNLITKGKMRSIDITEDYELIVDGFKISVRSGGQQDLASLAFRLSLSQSVINGMLPLFLADEVDSSGGEDTSNDIVEALDVISDKGFQIIMVTHKETTNTENINIIQL